MSELRRLTWKYFFKQKWKEIIDVWAPICCISLFSAIFFVIVGFIPVTPGELGLYPIMGFIGIGVFCFWILVGIIKLIKSICKWIRSNWVMATERAERELNTEEESISEFIEKDASKGMNSHKFKEIDLRNIGD